MNKIGVIGAGAWGTALAQVYAAAGRDVTLWVREAEVVTAVNERHENTLFLPGVSLDERLKASGDLGDVAACDVILLVTPAQHMRSSLADLKALLDVQTPLVICSKGIELKTGLLLSQVARDVLPEAKLAVLTGPTFAIEVAKGLPAAVTLACEDEALAQDLQDMLGLPHFRPYLSADMIGAQVGAALKNVIAIACGIIEGRGLGENARAALLTRGIAEMGRLAEALGGCKETLSGLCGIGDLVLTASSMQSRNFSFGAALGRGEAIEEILKARTGVTEGFYTAKAAADLAEKLGVDMPIAAALNGLLNEGLSVDAVIQDMLNRPFKEER
ncbi:MAG: NAD(P)-dependent glycerol-3-phosphate dehydrogenase [Alphaproteobacteria bacterium]|nr:NAD(P)-dependent glycerol-3-phosphate dehydrogenase [Alphaproteobacteria bacterium]